MEIIGYFLAALVGISLGLIGSGGSILMVPILVYVFALNPVLATSYSLFVVGATSLVGAFNNYRKGLVSIKTALLFGLTSVTTVFITRKLIMPRIPNTLFSIGSFQVKHDLATMVLFAILMLMASFAMIKGNSENTNADTNTSSADTAKLLLFGVLVGLTTGFLGAGGGFLRCDLAVLACQGLFHAVQDLVRVQWLYHVVERPAPDQFHRDAYIAVARDDDHRQGGVQLLHLVQQLQTVRIGQPVVAQHEVELLLAQEFQGDGPTTRCAHFIALLAEEPCEQRADVHVIIDHQQLLAHGSGSTG